MMMEKEYLWYKIRDGKLTETRFRSSMPWPKNGRMYALASDPEAVARCRNFAIANTSPIREFRRQLDEVAKAKAALVPQEAASEPVKVAELPTQPARQILKPPPLPLPKRRFA